MNHRSVSLFFAVLVLLGTIVQVGVPASPAAAAVSLGTAVETGMSLDFMAYDTAGEKVYLSSRASNEVIAVSTANAKIVRRFSLPQPTGLALSSDARTLYVALNGQGAVAEVDVRTGDLNLIDVSVDLGDDRTWDLLLVDDATLLVSGNPDSSGFAWIVRVDLSAANATDRVASNRIIRAGPRFGYDGGNFVYVGSGFSPNSLRKLDVRTDGLDIVGEDAHGSVGGTQRLAASSRGDFVLIGSGQKLDATTLAEVSAYGEGYPLFDDLGKFAYMVRSSSAEQVIIDVFNPATDRKLRTIPTTCSFGSESASVSDAAFVDGERFVIVAGRRVCLVGFDLRLPLCNGLLPTLLGTSGDDELIGSPADDVIIGGSGADLIDGLGGNDTECGNGGQDVFIANEGDDYTRGGPGGDRIEYHRATAPVIVSLRDQVASGIGLDEVLGIENVIGTPYDDVLRGNGRANLLEGGGGRDDLYGFKNADTLLGGAHDDYLEGGLSPDVLEGGGGDDFIAPGAGNDSVDGGAGEDWVSFDDAPGAVVVRLVAGTASGDGADTLISVEHVYGSPFEDTIIGDDLDNVLYGNEGHDVLKGGYGDDILVGQGGDDQVAGEAGSDVVVGNAGRDRLVGGTGFDIADFFTSPVGVTVDLSAGTATGDGPDTLISVEDIVGSTHNDVLKGTAQGNYIFGLEGNDTIFGFAADDYLFGDEGTDSLDGGAGADTCVDGENLTSCEGTQASALGFAPVASTTDAARLWYGSPQFAGIRFR